MKKLRVRRRIRSTLSMRKALAVHFECSEPMVRQSLTYSQHSRLARLIRREALLKGGDLVITLPVDNCFDDYGGALSREYPNDTRVWIDKTSGAIHTSIGIEVIATTAPPTDLDIDALQLWFSEIDAACEKAKGFPQSYERAR